MKVIHSKKITLEHLKIMKQMRTPIAAITAYDASFSRILMENGVDVILVGDSLGVLIAGYDTTIPVTLKQMIYHLECVNRGIGSQGPLLIADMPFLTYSDTKTALKSASKLMRAGAEIIKCEGGAWLADTVYQLSQNGIPFCGHLGLTPQSVFTEGYKVYLEEKEKQKITHDAKVLRDAGMQLLILKCVHHEVAKEITQLLDIPVIGIGAGIDCDGQFIILHDLLGLAVEHSTLMPKAYLNELGKAPKTHFRNFLETTQNGIAGAVQNYIAAVKSREFPNVNEQY